MSSGPDTPLCPALYQMVKVCLASTRSPEQVLGTPSHILRVLSTTLHRRGLYTSARTGEKQVNCPIVLHGSQPGPRAQTDLRAWKTLRQSPAALGETPLFLLAACAQLRT